MKARPTTANMGNVNVKQEVKPRPSMPSIPTNGDRQFDGA